ncbi:MAG: carboxypeptidase regulatory-like domain-containing protein [Muribaculaceae bacterium]|nr:carboxypeptidase regulatory-like domain-containing protein [Muribaculaceae bacterium]
MKNKIFYGLCLLLSSLILWSCIQEEVSYTGNIIGKVTDANTGMVLDGVTVTISPGGLSRTTGSSGIFEFRDLEPKQYEIQVQKDGYTTNSKVINVTMGADAVGDITMTPIEKNGKLALSVSSLNFGTQSTSLSFSILNNGNKSFNWNITGLDKLNWLSVSPVSGTLAAGKSNAVTVTLNRNCVTEYVEGTIIINTDNESLPLKITANIENISSKISLSATTLNFGTEYTTLSFDIKNIGNAGDVNWNITGVDADWIKVSPLSGTTSMNKSSVVKVDVDRNKMDAGNNSTTIIVNADGESLRVTINAEKASDRYLEIYPSALFLGTNDSESFIISSHNGSTAYQLYGRGDFEWASFSKVEGVIPEYDPNNIETVELIYIYADRTGLAPGEYTFTLIISTDLGDYELPVSMTVEGSSTPDVVSGEIISCHSDLEFTLTSCKMSGTTATIEYTVQNIGSKSLELTLWGSTGGYSYLYDDLGNEYKFGSQGASLTLGKESNSAGVSATIPSGVKVKGSVIIPYVADEASSFNVSLRSTFSGADLIFKNVAIQGRSSSSPDTPQTTGIVISCHDDLEFTLLDCKRGAGDKVTLTYKVKNITNKPHYLFLWGSTGGRSYIYDNQGNEYGFGSNGATLTLGNESSSAGVSATIPANAVVKGSIEIRGVESSATEMSNITLYSSTSSADLVFKNVKIR